MMISSCKKLMDEHLKKSVRLWHQEKLSLQRELAQSLSNSGSKNSATNNAAIQTLRDQLEQKETALSIFKVMSSSYVCTVPSFFLSLTCSLIRLRVHRTKEARLMQGRKQRSC